MRKKEGAKRREGGRVSFIIELSNLLILDLDHFTTLKL